MSWISEAHSEWHAVHGQYAVCPLDCGAGEAEAEAEHAAWFYSQPLVVCGKCSKGLPEGRKIQHYGAQSVRECYSGLWVDYTRQDAA